MRKRLAILLALCLTAIMAIGVIGSGAQFTKTYSGAQQLTVGTMDLTINTPYEVQCAPILVNTASNAFAEACPDANFAVTGGIVPDRITVHVDVSGAAEMNKFALSGHIDATSYGPVNLQTANGTDIVTEINPASTFDFAAGYAWSDLSAASMGNTIWVTYTITATQG